MGLELLNNFHSIMNRINIVIENNQFIHNTKNISHKSFTFS